LRNGFSLKVTKISQEMDARLPDLEQRIRELAHAFAQLKFSYEAEKNKVREQDQQKKDDYNKRFRDAYLCRNKIFL
jgi:hypothetical protein